MRNGELNGLVLQTHILKDFILKIETEKYLYSQDIDLMREKAKEATNNYKPGLRIQKFLQEYGQENDLEKKKEIYRVFLAEQVDEKVKFEDIFSLVAEDEKEGALSYVLKNGINHEYYLPQNAMDKMCQAYTALNGIGENVIKNSIQAFERFFSSLLKVIIARNPKAYLSNKTLSYATLITVKDVGVIVDQLIDKEVNDLMWDVQKTIGMINEKEKLGLENYKEIWDDYIETDLHRNIIIHNDGKVNEEYLQKAPTQYRSTKIGEKIKCNNGTIQKKVNNLIKMAYLLFFLLGKTERDADTLDEIAFYLLSKENWEIAQFAYELLIKLKNIPYEQKMVYRINLLIAKKHLFDGEAIKKDLLDLDVSGLEKKYILAKYLLLDDYAKCVELLEKCYPNDYNIYCIQTWPIFMDFRKTEEYKKFLEKHKEEFDKYSFRDGKDE